jgi:hypothetical protein
MRESTHRFLCAIAESLAPDRVATLYLFPPLRRGPVECGVAVLAGKPVPEEGASEARSEAAVAVLQRHPVYVARYSLILKGGQRGKWECEIAHEADAPLDTVEAVVWGVLARYAESGEPERFSGERLMEMISRPWWGVER